MWPRTEEEQRRERHCGFVAFMNRADGQAAKDEIQGIILYEYELKIGWGKAVSLPSQALPAPPPGHMAIRSKEGCNLIFSGTSGPPITTSVPNQNSELVFTPNVPDITVVYPEDEHLKHIIDTMALNVLDGGCAFEQAIMERGRGNPLFNFLFELGSKEHTYYVWRLYSFAQGDTLQRWRTEPYIMIAGSGRWIPPPLPAFRSPEHGKESICTYAAGKSRPMEAEQTLTDSQRDEFEDMLRALTLERSQSKKLWGLLWITQMQLERLLNAQVKNASAYRTKFEATLPDIMESFNDLYRSVTGRITEEALKERVLKVLQVWEDWFLFSDAYINGLRATFLRSGNSVVTSFHSICGDAPDIEKKGLIGNMNNADKLNQDVALAMGQGDARQELMNLPISELERRCRHNGLSLVGGIEMMVARLLSLEDAEKQRGYEVVDENAKYRQGHSTWEEVNIEPKRMKTSYDKVETKEPVNLASRIPIPQPELKAFVKKEKNDLILPTSRWAREADETDDEQKRSYSSGSDNAGVITFKTDEEDPKADPSIRVQPENEIDEEQRQKLRRIEVALIEYREYLEEQGMKNSEEIERKVAVYRKRLEADGLSGNQRVLPEKREKREDSRDSSRKRYRSESQNRSQTPPQKSLTRERVRDHDLDKDRHRDRDTQQHDLDKDRERRAKSSRHERDDHDRSRERDRDWRRRGMR
ncbi:mRNA splicing factor Cwf21 domain [Arabidopsis suecica]|uniref:mRNA splicing factor Cwf21 domain n=1 Tax=Arabidopsis suecica TaxID=45249 RepID=A0A8T1Z9R5_ARASU|nr:mRNA splicing factor Cwf21 domain [Arabidopsis suecica]